MFDQLGNEFRFKIMTRDRDFGDAEPYLGIVVDSWQPVGKSDVFYLSPEILSLLSLRRLIRSTKHDVIYLNSFFSPHFTIKPLLLRRFGLIPVVPVIVAPRGEFSSGALGLKSLKKYIYIVAAKAFGLYRGVVWQASSEHEEADIRQWFGNDMPVVVAPNIPPMIHSADELQLKRKKSKGCLRILFLSRISRNKNLDGALKMLGGLKGGVEFNIYGPMEDKVYWAECQKIINSLSENIEVKYCGSIEHDQVGTVMREHNLFFLPTLGENFGHVILEAFCAGCPVLISDQTPWRDLEEKGVGWDMPLDQEERFQAVLQRCVGMDGEEYSKLSGQVMEYGIQVTKDDKVVEQNRQLFRHALSAMSNNSWEKMNV